MDELREDFPLGTIGAPVHVAWGALYPASDESRCIPGSRLRIGAERPLPYMPGTLAALMLRRI